MKILRPGAVARVMDPGEARVQTLIYAFLILSTTIDYLRSINWVPGWAPYLVEAISGFVALYVIIGLVRSRFRYVRAAYLVTLAFMGVVFVCSAVANSVDAGPFVAGSRAWVRMLPFFLLPAVMPIGDRALQRQLMLLLAICFIQFPLALSQRFHEYGHEYASGDRTFGTLMLSGFQSIFLICAACVLAGFFIRKKLSMWVFIPILFWTLAATTINETKVTVMLVPVGFVATFLAGSPAKLRARNGLFALGLAIVCLAVFVPVYDTMEGVRNKQSIVDFFENERALEKYLSKDAEGSAKAAKRTPGRVDSLTVPIGILARDPANLAFGVGPGNSGVSSLGPQFSGRYAGTLDQFMQTTGSRLLADLGLFGIAGALMIFWLIFADSVWLADADPSVYGAVAVGWTGVIPVMVIAMFYISTSLSNGLSVAFWYLSGVLAARRAILGHSPSAGVGHAASIAIRAPTGH